MVPAPKKTPGACGETTESCSSPPPVSHSSRRLVTVSIIAASVLVFLGLVSLFVYCFIRRRRRQRRQQSLLAAEAANPGVEGGGHVMAAPATGVEGGGHVMAAPAPGVEGGGHVMAAPAPGVEGGGPEQGGGEEAVHHAWHIRTVGLDEAAIESIALTRYRAGAGMLGAADCSVCLGEFRDGELLRLLPKCGHAFHVPCIDTWLRAHVNCPLCRADVLDPDAAAGDSDPPAGANAGTVAEEASSNIDETLDHEQAGPGQQQNEQQELRVQIDQRDHPSSPEPLHRHPGSQVQKFRRVASMDSSLAPATESPEDELNSKEKQGNGGDTACFKVLSGSGRSHLMKRPLSGGGRWSLASRHCRTRSSVLPL